MRTPVAVVALVTVVAAGSYATADAYDVVPGVLTLAPPATATSGPAAPPATTPSSGTATPTPPTPSGTSTPSTPPIRTPAPTIAPLPTDAPRPVPARLRAAVTPALASAALRGQVSAYVVDVATGDVLLDLDAARPRVPASSAKLLTGAALLSLAESEERLRTRVVEGGPGEVVLVGGGDVLLSPGAPAATGVVGRAGLRDLAAQVAGALRSGGGGQTATVTRAAGGAVAPVRLLVDDSLFTGAAVSPQWQPADVRFGVTGPVTPLGLVGDHPAIGRAGAPDPALRAGQALAAELRRLGVGVTSVARAPKPAGADARELGAVSSAPLGDVVSWALATSDNQLTEVLARLVAVRAQRPADFAGATAAVLARVRALGVDTTGVRLVDGSGLATGTAIPARALGDLVALAAGPDERGARLRPVITGLPVAGLTGTLGERYRSGPARPAAGLVRAKTGTLTGVSSLTGTVQDADGRLLAFAFLADSTSSTSAARAALDRAAAALAACGCR